MAPSSVHGSGSLFHVAYSFSDSEYEIMKTIEEYGTGSTENIEKSLTNLNITLSIVAKQIAELKKSYIEFSATFNKQHELLAKKIQLIRRETADLRQMIFKHG